MSVKEILTGDKLATFDEQGYSLLKYPTPYTEFTCYSLEMRTNLEKNPEFNFKYPSIALVIKGDGSVSMKKSKDKDSESFNIREGQSFLFVPGTYYLFNTLEGGLHVYICTSQSLSLN
jgi:mannose-6-phosphate isomerase class I